MYLDYWKLNTHPFNNVHDPDMDFDIYRGIDSAATMRDYVEKRLGRAGRQGPPLFTDAAYEALWDVSEGGSPHLINKICSLALKAGETQCLTQVNAGLVQAIGACFQRTHSKSTRSAARKPPRSALPKLAEEKPPADPPVHAAEPPEAPIAAKPLEMPPSGAHRSAMVRESLASTIALERLKQMTDVVDPFHAWQRIKRKVIRELKAAEHEPMPHPVAS